MNGQIFIKKTRDIEEKTNPAKPRKKKLACED